MSKHGRAVSVSGTVHRRLRAWSIETGCSMRQAVETLAAQLLALPANEQTLLVEQVRRQSARARGRPSAPEAARARWSR